jgi:hypothetical protein
VAREIVQHAVIKVVRRQVVRYTCDFCFKVCGTRQNPKRTWYRPSTRTEMHYCMRTCHPGSAREALEVLANL